MKNILLSCALVTILLFGLVSCDRGSDNAVPDNDATPPPVSVKTRHVTIGTGGITGVYYPTGGAIAKLVNRKRDQYGVRMDFLLHQPDDVVVASSLRQIDNLLRSAQGKEVPVSFDEPGDCQLPVQFDDLSLFADPRLQLFVAADRRDPVAAHRNRFGHGYLLIHRRDPTAAKDKVGRLLRIGGDAWRCIRDNNRDCRQECWLHANRSFLSPNT